MDAVILLLLLFVILSGGAMFTMAKRLHEKNGDGATRE